MYKDRVIYGKNSLEKVVGIEIVDDKAEIFLQDGSSDIVDNSYWILSNESHGQGWSRLEGNLHYKWGKKYNKAGQYFSAKKVAKGKGADIFTVSDEKEAFMIKNGYTYYKGLTPKDISALSFDIETTGLNHDEESKILLISNTFRSNGVVTKKLFAYDEYDNQGAMLLDWAAWVCEMDPSIILGHNIYTFDLPYMHYIAEKEGIELLLGRNGSPIKFFEYESQKRVDGSRSQAYHKVRVYGREVVDTMFLAINYDVGKKYESYGLKKIIAQEKLESENRTFYDAGKIRFNYTNPVEWALIKAYCNDDSDDGLALFDLMSPSFFYLAQSIPKAFQAIVESASGSQINSMMVRAYMQDGHSIPKTSGTVDFEGAISMGNPGVYRNCFKVDVASLYPSIMIQHKIYDKWKDPKAYMAQIVQTFTTERLKNKKLAKETGIKHYDDMQNAQKIVINSMYGFMGAAGLAFNSPANAALVTKIGREVLQGALDWAANKAYAIVNADTDSITFTDNGTPIDEAKRKELLADLNSNYPEKIRFEDDGYYETIIVLKAKNYVLYDGKKIKTKGSALKDAKKEPALKEFLFNVIESIIRGEDRVVEIYQTYVKEAAQIQDIKRWASKKTISAKVMTSDRANETKILDAVSGTEFSEGDRIYVYYKSDDSLGLVEKFDGDYNKDKLIEKVFKTAQTFANIIPKEVFVNYKLKKNKKALEELLANSKV